MHFYRVIVAYKGTRYFGWQAQSTDSVNEERPTIEGTIQTALRRIIKHQHCAISGASRTDSGVHAQGQVAKITLPIDISSEHLLLGLNSLLPSDIRILECELSSKIYQPSRMSASKEYHYYFSVSPVENVATSDIALHLPIQEFESKHLANLKAACQLFVGEHDFLNFCSRDKNRGTSVRQVFYCDVHKANFSPLADDLYYLKIIGDGFLKYMIRYLMGSLSDLAKERVTLENISQYLQQHQDDKLSLKAKAKGLHLIHIEGIN